MEAIYFEVRGIDFPKKKDAQIKEYSKRIGEINDQLAAICKDSKKEELRRNLLGELEKVSDASLARGQSLAAEELERIAREINALKGVNLDSQRIKIFPMGIAGVNFGNSGNIKNMEEQFLAYQGSEAVWGYALDWRGDKAFIALRGEINPDKVEKALKKRGYAVFPMESIPRTGLFSAPIKSFRKDLPAQLEKVVEPANFPQEVARLKLSVKTFYDVLEKRAREGRLNQKEITMRLNGDGEYAEGGRYGGGRITQEQAKLLYHIIKK